jgi:cytochrome c oxidase assembly protein subunit 11
MARRTSQVWPFIAIPIGMLMMSYAAVPLYRMFCQATGFNGTTMRADQAPTQISDQTITVDFNADVDPNLPWTFKPLERRVTLKIGENRLTAFHVDNLSGEVTRGHAVYNVSPDQAGAYFNKIECFCFSEQTVGPYEKVNMPVSFFIDPAILEDDDLKDLRNITLSYTFFSYESANQPK